MPLCAASHGGFFGSAGSLCLARIGRQVFYLKAPHRCADSTAILERLIMKTQPNMQSQSRSYGKTILRGAVLLAALSAGLGAGLAQAASNDPAGTPIVEKTERVVSDSWITTKVKSEILANSVTKGFKVSVKTLHGVVALRGKLPSQDAIDQVKQIAEKVKGVTRVTTTKLTVAA